MVTAGPLYLTYDGRDFSEARPIDPARPVSDDFVACATSRFCMAVTQDSSSGEYFYRTWAGQDWSDISTMQTQPVGSAQALVCPSPAACRMIGGDESDATQILHFDGTNWRDERVATGGQISLDLACASPEYCILLGNSGEVSTYKDGAWTVGRFSARSAQSDRDPLAGISCTEGPLCLGVTHLGGRGVIDRGSGLEPLKGSTRYRVFGPCGTPAFCLATELEGAGGDEGVFDGKTFSKLPPLPTTEPVQPVEDKECTSDGVCVAIISDGFAAYTLRL